MTFRISLAFFRCDQIAHFFIWILYPWLSIVSLLLLMDLPRIKKLSCYCSIFLSSEYPWCPKFFEYYYYIIILFGIVMISALRETVWTIQYLLVKFRRSFNLKEPSRGTIVHLYDPNVKCVTRCSREEWMYRIAHLLYPSVTFALADWLLLVVSTSLCGSNTTSYLPMSRFISHCVHARWRTRGTDAAWRRRVHTHTSLRSRTQAEKDRERECTSPSLVSL